MLSQPVSFQGASNGATNCHTKILWNRDNHGLARLHEPCPIHTCNDTFNENRTADSATWLNIGHELVVYADVQGLSVCDSWNGLHSYKIRDMRQGFWFSRNSTGVWWDIVFDVHVQMHDCEHTSASKRRVESHACCAGRIWSQGRYNIETGAQRVRRMTFCLYSANCPL